MSLPSNPNGEPVILIYDSAISGHHGDYLYHLVRYLWNESMSFRSCFLVHPEFMERYSAYLPAATPRSAITFNMLDPPSLQRIAAAGSLSARSAREWTVVRTYAEDIRCRHCILMNMNIFQSALGMPDQRVLPFSVSGIFFSPYTRLDTTGRGGAGLTGKMRRLKKKYLLRWMLRNNSIQNVYILNDPATVRELNDQFPLRNVFRLLPDPVPVPPEAIKPEYSLRHQYQIPSSLKVFLFFGSINRRKGIFETIDIFSNLPPAVARGAALAILGNPDKEIRPFLDQAISRLQGRRSELLVIYDPRFFRTDEMHGAFKSADFILAPYLRTQSSSGVLGLAAWARKPVIGFAGGLLGELIRDNHLGYTIPTGHLEDFLRLIEELVRNTPGLFPTSGMTDYVKRNTPDHFAKIILGNAGL